MWDQNTEDDSDSSGTYISTSIVDGKIKLPDKRIDYVKVHYTNSVDDGVEIKYWSYIKRNKIVEALEAIELGEERESTAQIQLGGGPPELSVHFADGTYIKIYIASPYLRFNGAEYSVKDEEKVLALLDTLYYCEH